MPKAGDPDFATTAANFFSKDLSTNQTKAKALNKKRKQMMRMLLNAKDDQGEPLVDINN